MSAESSAVNRVSDALITALWRPNLISRSHFSRATTCDVLGTSSDVVGTGATVPTTICSTLSILDGLVGALDALAK